MTMNRFNLAQLALQLRSINIDGYFGIKTFANHFLIKNGIFVCTLIDHIKGKLLGTMIRTKLKLFSKVKVQEIKPIVIIPKYRVFRGFKPNLNYQRFTPNRNVVKSFKSNSLLGKVFGHYTHNPLVISATRNVNFQNTVGITLGLVGIRFYERNQEITLYDEKDELDFFCTSISKLFKRSKLATETSEEIEINDLSINQLNFGKYISKGSCAVVYEANLKSNNSQPLAVKMMFNYHAESNSADILRLMGKECLTFYGKFGHDVDRLWKTDRRTLNCHPNIIKILGIFTDLVPSLEDATKLFPAALPPRLYEGGCGRNMTLFLVMKQYHTNLKEFLTTHKPSLNTSLILLYQLFDGVDHLVKNKVAHRDLKTNNILLDLSHGEEYPWLVITDFGFASTSLKVPFSSEETNRGGNLALMAPEIIAPSGNVLDYTSADLWSCGAIGYEIMNELNPFYSYEGQKEGLFSSDYNENDLPDISSCTLISNLLKAILSRDPKSRPSAQLAACITFLLRYSSFNLEMLPNLAKDKLLVKSEKLLSWLKKICSMILFSGRFKPSNEIELQICVSFFSKLDPDILFKAIHFLKTN